MAQIIALHELLPHDRDWRFMVQMYKTRMCRYYTRSGGCRRGSACAFAHGAGESRAAPDLTKTSLCSAWRNRQCDRMAKDCPFAHGFSDLRVTPCFKPHKFLHSKAREIRKVREHRETTRAREVSEVREAHEVREANEVREAHEVREVRHGLSVQDAWELVRWASEDVPGRGSALRGERMATLLAESLPAFYED